MDKSGKVRKEGKELGDLLEKNETVDLDESTMPSEKGEEDLFLTKRNIFEILEDH
jgi:hypothetical protein